MRILLLAAISFLAGVSLAQPDVRVRVETGRPTLEVAPGMFGIFFEEINQAGEGGLSPELLRTPSFEDGDANRLPSGWKAVGDAGSVSLDPENPANSILGRSLRLERGGSGRFAAANEGFWGLPVRLGENYRLALWVRGETDLEIHLRDPKGGSLASASVRSKEWRRFETVLRPSRSESKARLEFSPKGEGKVWLGWASLRPERTWHALRPDLAKMIAELRPGFVRFPGGCYVEGNDLAQAFDWKSTLGPAERREPIARTMWGYPSSQSLGFHEYLLMAEALGAKGLFVVNCGMSHTQVAPMSEMSKYVRDALDAIEYATGPVDSTWGRKRAGAGHPKPFALEYIQIGNENGGPAYEERFALIAAAIRAKYPRMKIVADVWGGAPTGSAVEILDEHYYSTPSWMWSAARRYDTYPRGGPKIYVGEYAVTQNAGEGNLGAALAEAAAMTGFLRNADVVKMASYAPLLVNVNNRQWNPNAIVFDAERSYGTPSYWVQWLFSRNKPDRILAHSIQADSTTEQPFAGKIGLQTWKTHAEFRHVSLKVDGEDVPVSMRFEPAGGTWRVDGEVLSQSDLGENRRSIFAAVEIPAGAKRVVLSLQARKLGGDEGFIVMTSLAPGHEFQWNLGGWGNSLHAFQRDGGRIEPGVPGRIETDRWYDVRIEREGRHVRGYLDGLLVQEIEEPLVEDFAGVAGLDQTAREIVLFLVNGAPTSRNVELSFVGPKPRGEARGWVLSGKNLTDENSFQAPSKVRPQAIRVSNIGRIPLQVGQNSVTVLRVPTG